MDLIKVKVSILFCKGSDFVKPKFGIIYHFILQNFGFLVNAGARYNIYGWKILFLFDDLCVYNDLFKDLRVAVLDFASILDSITEEAQALTKGLYSMSPASNPRRNNCWR